MNHDTMQLHAYSPTRPLLLLADYPADTPGGGAEVIRSLLNEEDCAKIIWITPGAVTARSAGKWRGHATLSLGKTNGQADLILASALRPGFARKLSARLLEIAEQENASAVWIIMQGACVFIAAQLLKHHPGRLRVHLSVHDDPINYTLLSRRRFFLAPLVSRSFSQALKRAASVDVISAGMVQAYAQRYGVKAGCYHRGVDFTFRQVPANPVAKELSIGVLGNTYGLCNVNALLEALSLASKLLKINASVLLIGQSLAENWQQRFGGTLNVNAIPYTDERAAVEHLSKCFALYLTYPFSRLYRLLRTSSFPTKLSTYGLAARPLLLHAPEDSQVMQLVTRGGYGTAWTNLEPEVGCDVLADLWLTCDARQDFQCDADQMLHKYFDRAKNRRVLLEYLNELPTKTMAAL